MDNYEIITSLIFRAQENDNEAMTKLINQFDSLLIKLSRSHYGYIDEDCYQILAERFIKAVRQFDFNYSASK